MAHNIGIYVFDQVEVLDFAGPYEVFTTATRMAARQHGDQQPLFQVFTIAALHDNITARAGLKITPDYTIGEHPPLDCLIVAGGVIDGELGKPQVIDWIAAQIAQNVLTASVCTGAFLLAKTGALDGREVITHWEDVAALRAMFPALHVKDHRRWIDNGQLVTSAGISAGIDMSLHLVERFAGQALAARTARQLDFDWTVA